VVEVVKRGDRRTTGVEPDETEQRPTKKKEAHKDLHQGGV
jgi:hypothetical protein